MKIAFIILVIIHGLIHTLGFLKGLGLKDVKELTLPISKPMGMLWLIVAVLMLLYGLLYGMNTKYAWIVGMLAALLSQFLIVMYWKDARFGTIPNLVIIIVSIVAYGQYNFQRLVHLETTHLLEQNDFLKQRIITETDIAELPPVVKKWLYRSEIIGRPNQLLGKVIQRAEMQLKPDQSDWLTATAVQYSAIDNPAFLWIADVNMNPLLFFRGRDKFEDGQGTMLIKLNALFNIVNESGDKINEGSLQRYLGEMVWFPTLALSPHITWDEINDTSATATMHYKGTQGSGTFHFNREGDFVKFSADRYMGNEPESKRQEWVLEVEAYRHFEGVKVPSKMTATWKLEDRDWTWLKLEIVDLMYNERVGSVP